MNVEISPQASEVFGACIQKWATHPCACMLLWSLRTWMSVWVGGHVGVRCAYIGRLKGVGVHTCVCACVCGRTDVGVNARICMLWFQCACACKCLHS